MFRYDVDLHFKNDGWDTYTVKADCIANARYNAMKRVEEEINTDIAGTVDCIRIYPENSDILLREYNI